MLSHREFKNAIFEEFARLGKALSSPRRLELLDLLQQGERTVEVLAGLSGLSLANTSRHLQVLRSARLVETERSGTYVTYRLADKRVGQLLLSLRELAESRLAEVAEITRRYLQGREGMEPVDCETLLRRTREGEVTVLDVRPQEEYHCGHLPGAVSIPLAELEERLHELPADQEIVAYCRGPYCVLSVQAVELLRSRGFRALRLEEGVPDWKSRGLPVAGECRPKQPPAGREELSR